MFDNLIEEHELKNKITALETEQSHVKKAASEQRAKIGKFQDPQFAEAKLHYEKEFEKSAKRLNAIKDELKFLKDCLEWRGLLNDDERLLKHLPSKYLPHLFPKLKDLSDYGTLDEGLLDMFSKNPYKEAIEKIEKWENTYKAALHKLKSVRAKYNKRKDDYYNYKLAIVQQNPEKYNIMSKMEDEDSVTGKKVRQIAWEVDELEKELDKTTKIVDKFTDEYIELFNIYRGVKQHPDQLLELVPTHLLHHFNPKLKPLADIGVMDESIVQRIKNKFFNPIVAKVRYLEKRDKEYGQLLKDYRQNEILLTRSKGYDDKVKEFRKRITDFKTRLPNIPKENLGKVQSRIDEMNLKIVEFEKRKHFAEEIRSKITAKLKTFSQDEIKMFSIIEDLAILKSHPEKLEEVVPANMLYYFKPKLKNITDIGILDEGIAQRFKDFFKKEKKYKITKDDPFYEELSQEKKRLEEEHQKIQNAAKELHKMHLDGQGHAADTAKKMATLNQRGKQILDQMSELQQILHWYLIIKNEPNRLSEVPDHLITKINPKLSKVDKNYGIFEHLKTFEEYNLYDNYLHDSNNVKEILSNYNLKYEIFEENPTLTIIFPYAEATYGGQWVDDEYKLILSFLKELSRYNYKFTVNETETTTTVIITF